MQLPPGLLGHNGNNIVVLGGRINTWRGPEPDHWSVYWSNLVIEYFCMLKKVFVNILIIKNTCKKNKFSQTYMYIALQSFITITRHIQTPISYATFNRK